MPIIPDSELKAMGLGTAPSLVTPPTPTSTSKPSKPATSAPPKDDADMELSLPTEAELKELHTRLKTGSIAQEYKDPGADVAIVNGIGKIDAVLLGIALMVLIHVVIIEAFVYADLPYGFNVNPLMQIVALAINITLFILFHDRFWTAPDAQEVEAYVDRSSGKIYAYRKFGFIYPWYTHSETVRFKTDEIKVCALDKEAFEFRTSDPWGVKAEYEAIAKPIDTEEGLKRYLRYKTETRTTWIKAMIESRIAAAGGRNKYRCILKHQNEFATWVALIFGGEGVISEFEQSIGTTISNPAIKNLQLTEEAAKKIAQSKSRVDEVADAVRNLTGQDVGLSADKAADIAALALEIQTKSVIRFEGVDGVKVFAPGSDLAALAGLNRGGKK